MKKQNVVRMNIGITARQHEMLKKLSEVSLKSQAALIREGIELLFKTPGK